MGAIAGLLLAATVIVLYAAGGAARDDDTGTAGHRHLGVVATPSPPGALAVEADPDSDAAARYRVLAARATGRNGSGARSIVVVDSGDEETRGVVAGNIAAAVAEAGRSVVLVDATATGGVTDLLGLRDAEGYADMDPNGGRLNDELEGRLIEYSGRLTVLPRGHSVPRDMMAHDRLRALLALLHERADVVRAQLDRGARRAVCQVSCSHHGTGASLSPAPASAGAHGQRLTATAAIALFRRRPAVNRSLGIRPTCPRKLKRVPCIGRP
jgi:hypothetical protein